MEEFKEIWQENFRNWFGNSNKRLNDGRYRDFEGKPESDTIIIVYQLSKARTRFGDEITVLPQATFRVSNGNNIVARNFARFTANDVKADTLPLEKEPVDSDKSTSWTLKPQWSLNFRRALLLNK